MNKSFVDTSFRRIISCLFFIAFFLYFFIFNRYLLIYHEQIQLFRFDWNYFKDFMASPGGLMRYTGAFLTQFYLFPFAGASIVTLAGLFLYFITTYIFRKHQIPAEFFALLPVLLLAGLHSHYLYTIACTLGIIVSLGYFAIYISIINNNLRYLSYLSVWPLLYFLTGGYALVSLLLCLVHELLYTPRRSLFLTVLLFLLPGLLVPFLFSHFIFYIRTTTAWTILLPLFIEPPVRYILISLLVYYPLVLIFPRVWLMISKRESDSIALNWKTGIAGFLAVVCLAGIVIKKVYDRKTELLLGIDYCVQHSDWKGVLKLSSAYPGTNRLVIYFTDLALYKSGHLGDNMFHYPQAGANGLWLRWERNGITPFFGGEIYYQLEYTSEAYRWAFEAMVAKGPNPRCLKRLALTSLVNGDIALAGKYLNVLNQSLFYRGWAQNYLNYVNHPELITNDGELAEKIHFEINSDFMSSRDNSDIRLRQLLENHPDNRMAFEYMMASMLLEKNLSGFAANIYRLKDLGYASIPVHYEEALLACMSYGKKDLIPEGYSISAATQDRFSDYAKMYFSFKENQDNAARAMYSKFGKTFWYYFKFNNNQATK